MMKKPLPANPLRTARAALAMIALALASMVSAQVPMSATGSYSQDFNTLSNSGATNTWTDNTTITSWYWQNTGTGLTYAADAGSGTGGNKYSYGSAASSDRAMGSLGSGNAAAGSFAWGVLLQNTSAQTITNITVTYTGEQWRNSAAAAQTVAFYYKTSASPITALNPNSNGTWTAVTALNFISPVTGGAAGALDGNAGANRTVIAATAIPALALAPGSYIMLKWDDPDHTGTDHGLSIDDVTINYTVSAPVLTSSTITFSSLTSSSVDVNLAGGTGAGRIVVAKAGSAVGFSPTNGTSYSGANSDFTLGNDLGGGNILVYNGSGTSVSVTNLQPSTTYHFATWDYDGTTTYSTPAGTNNVTTPGPILYSSGTYSQNFNTLPNTGTFTPGVPGPLYANLTPVNASGMGGWQYARVSGSNANVLFAVNDGTGTSGSVYSYGTGTNADRALGLLASGANVDAIGAVIRNTSGGPLTTFTITFTGEQWRVANAAQQVLAFSYSLNGSDISTGTYTPVTQLNFISPQVSGTASALDGNLVANQASVSFTVDMGTNWMPGSDLVIKWADNDDSGSDHGLGIDDFSFSASGPVAPTTQDHDISFANVTTVGADITWVNGDGSKHMVVMNTANSFTTPTNGAESAGNSVYGGGEQVIYVGTGSTVSVSNLAASTQYFVRAFGYNGLTASAVYNTSTATLNPNDFTTATPIPPTQLVITSINGGVDPIQDAPPLFPHSFFITVQAQDGSNSPQNVLANTTVTLTLNTGNGVLGGTLTGVITAGTNQVTITGITYDTGEAGVIVDATATAGDPLTATTSAPFTVLGVATNLNLANVPSNGLVNTAISTFQVQALRDDASVDVNYNGQITVALLSGPGNIGGTTQVIAVNGIATFSNVTFDAAGPYQIQATANGLFSANSGIIYITLPATMTELVVPKYMGSKSAASANATRTPFAVCVQFDNLVPNTVYDLRAGVALTSDAATSYGAGNIWNGSLYGTGNINGAFTSDGSGSSGPYWLFLQPTGNATRFSAGQVHNLRISAMISGNPSPTSPQFVGSKTITALDIAPTALTPATTDDGAYVRGTSQSCISGKFILVYDNAAGTGDPLSVYQAITTTPTDATAGNYSSHPASISDTYRQTGTAVAGDYPAVVPIGANNPNGVRRIEARNADNTLFNAITDADGVWPGGADFTVIARRAVGNVGGTSDPHLDTAPSVTTGTYGAACSNESDITLGGSPANGVWTGTGVSGTGPYTFSPTAGTQTLTYTYTDGNACVSSGSTSITVNTAPTVSCPGDLTGICSSDVAFALTGGTPAGGVYSGTGVSGGNFDPNTAGAGTHTITYVYTDGNTCSDTCTFTIDVTQATTWYSDLVDGDGLGDPNASVMACSQPVGYVTDNTDLCPNANGTIGSPCTDNNPFTTGDALDANCQCVGTPVPCDNWTLTFTQGDDDQDDNWQIVDANSPFVLQSGGPYAAGSVNVVTVCVPQGACFNLNVTDNLNNGMPGGGWSLVDNTGHRILDNEDNGASFETNAGTAEPFCNEPASNQSVIATHCDRENWLSTDVIIASADPAVSAQWGIGDQSDDGYQFWFQNPVGGYTRKVFRNHATSGGNGPANALRATKLALASIVSNPLPVGTLLNVRVRSRVNGVNGKWGPACRFRIDPSACTLTKLNDVLADPHFSCGVTGKVVNAGGDAGKIFAKVVTSGGNPATNYRFEISEPGQGYLRNAISTNAALVLAQWVSNPLLCGAWTYNVRVQASFDGGNSYCPFGDVCTVQITNTLASPMCTPTVGNIIAGGGSRNLLTGDVELTMYPNPNRGDQLFLTLAGLNEEIGTATVAIFDSFGKQVLSRQVTAHDGTLKAMLELDRDMAAGLYVVNITAGELTRTQRLVIER